jgi:hypothetical protein
MVLTSTGPEGDGVGVSVIVPSIAPGIVGVGMAGVSMGGAVVPPGAGVPSVGATPLVTGVPSRFGAALGAAVAVGAPALSVLGGSCGLGAAVPLPGAGVRLGVSSL